jgi:hypothetical protein
MARMNQAGLMAKPNLECFGLVLILVKFAVWLNSATLDIYQPKRIFGKCVKPMLAKTKNKGNRLLFIKPAIK